MCPIQIEVDSKKSYNCVKMPIYTDFFLIAQAVVYSYIVVPEIGVEIFSN